MKEDSPNPAEKKGCLDSGEDTCQAGSQKEKLSKTGGGKDNFKRLERKAMIQWTGWGIFTWGLGGCFSLLPAKPHTEQRARPWRALAGAGVSKAVPA